MTNKDERIIDERIIDVLCWAEHECDCDDHPPGINPEGAIIAFYELEKEVKKLREDLANTKLDNEELREKAYIGQNLGKLDWLLAMREDAVDEVFHKLWLEAKEVGWVKAFEDYWLGP